MAIANVTAGLQRQVRANHPFRKPRFFPGEFSCCIGRGNMRILLAVSARSPFETPKWGANMSKGRCVRVNVTLTPEVQGLINRAITGGRYSSASEYVRASIVSASRRSGDKLAKGINPKVKMGRPKAA